MSKFYTFNQNNSGGYFVTDIQNGVSEYVIIEALTSKDAYEKLEKIGEKVAGFWDYCGCCGQRWSNYMDDEDGTLYPEIYGMPVDEYEKDYSDRECFIHYKNGDVKHIIFK